MTSNDEFLNKRDFIYGDPKLQAALALAEECHAGQVRKDGTLAIEHPKLVCNLLDWLGRSGLWHEGQGPAKGEDFEIQKAVALLHDALEDCKRYKPTKENLAKLKEQIGEENFNRESASVKEYQIQLQLEADLTAKLFEKYSTLKKRELTDTEKGRLIEWSYKVFEGALALTHGEYKGEDKRFYKVDAARALPDKWKPIRSLDQTASIIADILHSNMEGIQDVTNPFVLEGLREDKVSLQSLAPAAKVIQRLQSNLLTSEKAVDVSRALAEKSNHDDPYHELFKRSYIAFTELYELACVHGKFAEASKAQQAFNIVENLEKAFVPAEERVKLELPRVIRYERDSYSLSRKGVMDITVPADKRGRVISYSVWVTDEKINPDKVRAALKPHKGIIELNANEMSSAILQKLEEKKGVRIGTEGKIGSIRFLSVSGQVRFETFMEIAKSFGAIDKPYLLKITKQREIDNKNGPGGDGDDGPGGIGGAGGTAPGPYSHTESQRMAGSGKGHRRR